MPTYDLSERERDYLARTFTYHAPKNDQPPRYVALRAQAATLATAILTTCPPSRERTIAIGKLEEAMMWANASIARNE